MCDSDLRRLPLAIWFIALSLKVMKDVEVEAETDQGREDVDVTPRCRTAIVSADLDPMKKPCQFLAVCHGSQKIQSHGWQHRPQVQLYVVRSASERSCII